MLYLRNSLAYLFKDKLNKQSNINVSALEVIKFGDKVKAKSIELDKKVKIEPINRDTVKLLLECYGRYFFVYAQNNYFYFGLKEGIKQKDLIRLCSDQSDFEKQICMQVLNNNNSNTENVVNNI